MNAIYVRVSTDEQARTGYSLHDQLASCRSRLISLGMTDIQEYIDDGYSGEFLERPALDRLRDDLRAKRIQVVIAYDPDRLSRNLTNQLLLSDDIEQSGAQLLFVTGDYDASPEGRLFFSMKGAIAAYEKAKIRERTTRGRRSKALSGKVVINNKPYGFNWDTENSTYTINEEEAKIVHLIYDLCLNNNWGAPKITAELYARGICNRKGKPFNSVYIYRILKKELYCGTAYSLQLSTQKISQYKIKVTNMPKENWIPIPIPSIETIDRWKQVQKVIEQNGKLSKRNTKRDYLLRGILKCGICGMGMVASHVAPTGKIHHYYRCVTKSSPQYSLNVKCPNRYIPVDALEESVWEAFVSIASTNAHLIDFLREKHLPSDHSDEIAKLSKERDNFLQKRSKLLKWYRTNIIDCATAESELQIIDKELFTFNTTLTALQKTQEKIREITVVSPEQILNANAVDKKRQILLHSAIEVHVKRISKTSEFWFQ
jgi:site-specific DNA recombinase